MSVKNFQYVSYRIIIGLTLAMGKENGSYGMRDLILLVCNESGSDE